ncbi:YafY family transcriptional regulator [Ramlibacter sp. G-1-2-2]|uniref:YafY family transcriptional regulator n=1 Tax=Ramlibacter agri TaxID=2728837 RepID=A0A848H9Z0_9BURK|nr:YafY family protein [Ramlibacter agri]NML46832.1 YafY family transcriptional regulator [Ramlibacter agri]
MSRAERLLQLMQVLRRQRAPASGAALSQELGVSLRTLYRDIASLQAQGAAIEGEAGVGYVLRPGFTLPPLMLSEEEIEALVLGSRWVARHTDPELAAAARNALAKIHAVLPPALRLELETSALLVPGTAQGDPEPELADVRRAIRREHKLRLAYRDAKGEESQRVIWPFALGFFQQKRVVAAWCEHRADYRHFRVDRIAGLEVLDDRYPRRRQQLLKEWQASEGIQVTLD